MSVVAGTFILGLGVEQHAAFLASRATLVRETSSAAIQFKENEAENEAGWELDKRVSQLARSVICVPRSEKFRTLAERTFVLLTEKEDLLIGQSMKQIYFAVSGAGHVAVVAIYSKQKETNPLVSRQMGHWVKQYPTFIDAHGLAFTLHHVETEDEIRFLQLYCNGGDLIEAMMRRSFREFNRLQKMDFLIQLLEIVRLYHERGFCFLDLKPDNILLDVLVDGTVHPVIGDLDYMCNVSDQQAQHTLGSVDFMSPERYINKGFDPRKDDCWALGCILYEFISGRAVQWADEKGSKTTLLKHFWDMDNIGRRYLLQMRESVERTSTPGIWRIIEGLLSPESERWSVAQAIEALNEFKLDFMR